MGDEIPPKALGIKNACQGQRHFPTAQDRNCQECSPCGTPAKPECIMYRYRPQCCEKGYSAHHVLPVRCFTLPGQRKLGTRYQGCEGYDDELAPCICLSSQGPESKHKKIHSKFDSAEFQAGQPDGVWTYEEASQTAAAAISQQTGCSKECIKGQLDDYHLTARPGGAGLQSTTTLRADPHAQMDSSKQARLPTKAIVMPLPVP